MNIQNCKIQSNGCCQSPTRYSCWCLLILRRFFGIKQKKKQSTTADSVCHLLIYSTQNSNDANIEMRNAKWEATRASKEDAETFEAVVTSLPAWILFIYFWVFIFFLCIFAINQKYSRVSMYVIDSSWRDHGVTTIDSVSLILTFSTYTRHILWMNGVTNIHRLKWHEWSIYSIHKWHIPICGF